MVKTLLNMCKLLSDGKNSNNNSEWIIDVQTHTVAY